MKINRVNFFLICQQILKSLIQFNNFKLYLTSVSLKMCTVGVSVILSYSSFSQSLKKSVLRRIYSKGFDYRGRAHM